MLLMIVFGRSCRRHSQVEPLCKERKLESKNEFVADRYEIECTCMGLTTLELFGYSRRVRLVGVSPTPTFQKCRGDPRGRPVLVRSAVFLSNAFPFFWAFSSGG